VIKLQESKGGVVFKVLMQPCARRNEIAGMYEDYLKIRVTSPPIEGKANQACIDLIAQAFGLKKNEIAILSGHTARRKRLHARGITPEEFKTRLDHLIK